ncbi:MAG: UbiA-like polyprenyltransferase [Acidobacteriota bacterium]
MGNRTAPPVILMDGNERLPAAASPGGPARSLAETFTLIRFSHTLFALPFAFTGMVLAARGLPSLPVLGWIVAAMVGARTAAMTFNRLLDRPMDAANPRTAGRSLPAGRLTTSHAWGVFGLGLALLLLAAWRLNPLALALAPLAVVIICGYSLTKRFTHLTHLFLGLSLAGAPLGAWIAVRADLGLPALLLAAAVLFWTAGFDVIYSLQDLAFDQEHGLHSLPVHLGAESALRLAKLFHLLAVVFLLLTAWPAAMGWIYLAGVALAALLLLLEHRLVGPGDLSRLQLAFFRLNVAVSFLILAAACLDLLLT